MIALFCPSIHRVVSPAGCCRSARGTSLHPRAANAANLGFPDVVIGSKNEPRLRARIGGRSAARSADGWGHQSNYDTRGHLSSLLYPDGRELDYTYDPRGMRSTITAKVGMEAIVDFRDSPIVQCATLLAQCSAQTR
jgi:YD repeat-containing protein